MNDSFNLTRFVEAQGILVYEKALQELTQGEKQSHWMWYIFPQLNCMGYSRRAKFYGISGLEEAEAYLQHSVLGPRLRQISGVILSLDESDPICVFGEVDALKLRSSMTLLDKVSPGDVFDKVLSKYFGGVRDEKTLAVLR